MKFKAADAKTVILVMIGIGLMGALFYLGEKLPGVEQIREGYTD